MTTNTKSSPVCPAPARYQAHQWLNHGFSNPSKRTEARRETNGFIVWLTPREGIGDRCAPGAPFLWFVSFGEAKEMNLPRAARAPKSTRRSRIKHNRQNQSGGLFIAVNVGLRKLSPTYGAFGEAKEMNLPRAARAPKPTRRSRIKQNRQNQSSGF
jgi:hypothetical protein